MAPLLERAPMRALSPTPVADLVTIVGGSAAGSNEAAAVLRRILRIGLGWALANLANNDRVTDLGIDIEPS